MPGAIEASIDIARTTQEVFDYVADPATLPDWQPSLESAGVEPPGLPTVGMRGHEVRRVPGGSRTFRWEVTECDPGRRWAVRGIDGAVRAHVLIILAEADGGASTHLDYSIWFEGRGIGKVIRLLARQGARKEVPASLALLKERVESSGSPSSTR